MTLKIDIAGKKFCRLTVLGEAGRTNKVITWLCACDCGKRVVVRGTYLRSGKTRSCGCIAEKHGHATRRGGRIPEYAVWNAMRSRCNTPTDAAFHNYGGRGITVCPRWDDFANFMDDMGPRPSSAHTLERVKNHLGYSPTNCEWVTRGAQNRNKRNTLMVEYKGSKIPLIDAAAAAGIHYDTLRSRIMRLGWDEQRALTEPVNG